MEVPVDKAIEDLAVFEADIVRAVDARQKSLADLSATRAMRNLLTINRARKTKAQTDRFAEVSANLLRTLERYIDPAQRDWVSQSRANFERYLKTPAN